MRVLFATWNIAFHSWCFGFMLFWSLLASMLGSRSFLLAMLLLGGVNWVVLLGITNASFGYVVRTVELGVHLQDLIGLIVVWAFSVPIAYVATKAWE